MLSTVLSFANRGFSSKRPLSRIRTRVEVPKNSRAMVSPAGPPPTMARSVSNVASALKELRSLTCIGSFANPPSHTFCDVHCLRLATNLAIVDRAIYTQRPRATHRTRFLVGHRHHLQKTEGGGPCGPAALVRCSIARSPRRLTSSRPAAYAAGCRPSPQVFRPPCTPW